MTGLTVLGLIDGKILPYWAQKIHHQNHSAAKLKTSFQPKVWCPMKTPPDKIDLFKTHKADYTTPRKPVLLTIAPAVYLVAEGQGRPGGTAFQERIGALYGVAFTIKMTRKFAGLQDYAVCKLEAQYFFDRDPSQVPMEEWRWRMMIRTPDFIKKADLAQARAALAERGNAGGTSTVTLERITEGRCVQMLHVGPYDREGETVEIMKDFARREGWQLKGPHHEIYLSDPRRVAPEKLRTILRIPIKRHPAFGQAV
jgi:hypothetical protein